MKHAGRITVLSSTNTTCGSVSFHKRVRVPAQVYR